MTSVFLTRRAMLSGSAMLSIGTLFAACGQQAANEAVAAASAAPSETASAVAAASESPSASATLKPVVTRGYSAVPRHLTASIARQTDMVLHRMFLFRKQSRSSTPSLNKASTV